MITDQTGQSRVTGSQPAPLGDTIGLVVELGRPQAGKITEQTLLQQARV